jgi:hypothetical protein
MALDLEHFELLDALVDHKQSFSVSGQLEGWAILVDAGEKFMGSDVE